MGFAFVLRENGIDRSRLSFLRLGGGGVLLLLLLIAVVEVVVDEGCCWQGIRAKENRKARVRKGDAVN